MDSMKYTYDELGERSRTKLEAIRESDGIGVCGEKPKTLAPDGKGQRGEQDLMTLLESNHVNDPVLHSLWREIHTVPPWVSWAQIGRGQDVFYRYGGPALTGLCFQSLLGGLVGRYIK